MKNFTHAGVSRRYNGPFKARFATDMSRVKTLTKTGHSDIDLIELPREMSKLEAVTYLIALPFHPKNDEIQAALIEAKTKREPVVKEAKPRGRPKGSGKKAVEAGTEGAEGGDGNVEQVADGESTETLIEAVVETPAAEVVETATETPAPKAKKAKAAAPAAAELVEA